MNDTLVYRHRKPNGEVFYIGIGNEKRPYVKHNRSDFWFKTVKKHGYEVEVIAEGLSWEDACELEELLILEYGRRDLGLGTLVNMTNGGDGVKGVRRSVETRKKLSESNKGKTLSVETRKKMSEAQKGPKHTAETRKKMSESHKGRTHSAETRKKISEASKGKTLSAETRKKLSKANKGKLQPKIICPHCNKTGGRSLMTRYHFDNCKNK